jgi:hypothetical protein
MPLIGFPPVREKPCDTKGQQQLLQPSNLFGPRALSATDEIGTAERGFDKRLPTALFV